MFLEERAYYGSLERVRTKPVLREWLMMSVMKGRRWSKQSEYKEWGRESRSQAWKDMVLIIRATLPSVTVWNELRGHPEN